MSIQEMMDAVEADACKRSFYQFIKSFWGIICTDAFVDNWHVKYIADELQQGAQYIFDKKEVPYKLLINISPGTSKSSIILYLYPVWVWINDDTQRFITTSHSASLSIKAGVKSRDILQSPKFKRLFKNIKIRRDLSAKTFYQLENGGNRTITSKTGSVTGQHASFILSDDISDASKANSETDKIQTINHIQTISSREAKAGHTFHVYLQQRLSEDDSTAYLLQTIDPQNIKHICLPAILSDNVKPFEARKYYNDEGLFDPIRLSMNVLEKKKKELGTLAFSAQYMQSPVPIGGNLVQSAWFTTITREYSILSSHLYNTFIDTAYKEANKSGEPTNDPTGFITTYFENNTLYVSDYQEVWMNIMDLCRYLDKDLSKVHSRQSRVYIEPKASGVSIVQAMREMSNLNVCEIKGRKESKLVELTAILPLLESGRVVLVEGKWNELFIKRLTEFPYGKHDEAVDVLCYALNHYIKNDTSKQEAKMKANIRRML